MCDLKLNSYFVTVMFFDRTVPHPSPSHPSLHLVCHSPPWQVQYSLGSIAKLGCTHSEKIGFLFALIWRSSFVHLIQISEPYKWVPVSFLVKNTIQAGRWVEKLLVPSLKTLTGPREPLNQNKNKKKEKSFVQAQFIIIYFTVSWYCISTADRVWRNFQINFRQKESSCQVERNTFCIIVFVNNNEVL